MIPTLTPAQAAWLDARVGRPSRVLSPEDAACLGAQRGYLLSLGGSTILVAKDLEGRWILGGRPGHPQAPWYRARIFRPVPQALWPATDHALLLPPGIDQPAHQRLAATALADALDYAPTQPWPSLVAVGSPGALLLFGVPVLDADGYLQAMPPGRGPLPPLLAVLPRDYNPNKGSSGPRSACGALFRRLFLGHLRCLAHRPQAGSEGWTLRA
jgi:hypothetical protein